MSLAALAVLVACVGPVASASADRAPALRYQTHARGDLASAGNTLLTCPVAVAACGPARNGTGGGRQNNNFNMEYVDVDADPATFNSSSATLDLPAGATVTFAGLYWGADTSAGGGGVAAPAAAFASSALLDTPAAGGYEDVTGSQHDEASAAWPGRYQEFADVTELVAAAGAGEYTLANVQAGTGVDRYGGWTLVVAYRVAGEPVRNLSVFDGLVTIQNTMSYDLTVDGFETPGAGVANASLGIVTYEGDYGISGDGHAFNGTTLSDPINGSNNFFNSSISDRGTRVASKNPDYVDQLGFDSDRVSADGLIPAGATSAGLHLTTNGDTYFVGAVTVSTDQVPEPPVSGGAPVVSGAAEDGQTLTATTGSWTGTDPMDFEYQWQRCDASGASCADIPGATGPSYELTDDDVGSTVRVVVTATNEFGTDTAASAPSGQVAAVAPQSTSDPAVSGTPADEQTLTADEGDWDGTGPFDLDYQWQRCDAAGANCVDIPGATGSTYELGDDDAGHTVVVVVTATNDQGSQTVTSDPTGVVAAVQPTSTAAPAISGSQQAGETLTADQGTWSGTGPFDIDYQWQRCDLAGANCVDIPGADEQTYELTGDDVGHTVVVIVTATNPQGSDSVTSAPSAPIAAPASGGGPGSGGPGGGSPGGGSTDGDSPGDGSTDGFSPGDGAPGDGSAGAPGADADPAAALALLPGSSIASASCRRVTGNQVLAFRARGAGRFRIRVGPAGVITAARPLRAAAPLASGGAWRLTRHVRRVVYRLGGRRIAVRRRAPWTVRIGPGMLRRAERQTLTVRVVPRKGKPRVARVQLTSKPCSELFTVVHRPNPARSLLGLRVDSVRSLRRLVFRVPARLLPGRGERGVAGKLRVRIAGRRATNYRLSFPRRRGRATTLLAGAGRPRVQVRRGRIVVSGLPSGTGGIRLRLRARGMPATPRVVLRALIESDGATRRLTQRLGKRR